MRNFRASRPASGSGLGDISFSAKVIGAWKLGIEFYDQYDSKPLVGTEPLNDYRVATTVNYTF